MHHAAVSGIARNCRGLRAFHSSATILLACLALAFSVNFSVVAAQDAKPAAAPTAPSPGKALICIYRVSRFVGSASHDHLYINGIFLATLLNGDFACMEVAPGTAVVTGLPKMYYGGVIQSTGAALNEARKKENERIRLDVEAGKTYYLKWTSEAMATGIKVIQVDEATGTKEMKKLHPSKPGEEKDDQKQDAK